MSEKNTALALTKDNTVPEFLKRLDEELKAIKKIQDTAYKTSKKITMGGGSILDISTETSAEKLVLAYSGVRARIQALEAAYADLGIESYPVTKMDGGSAEEWKADIQLRLAIINQAERMKQIENMKSSWNELLDKEDRKAILIDEMKKFMGTTE